MRFQQCAFHRGSVQRILVEWIGIDWLSLWLLVLSGNEPVGGFRTFIFRRVRSDDLRRDDDSSLGQPAALPSSVDGELVQNRLRHLHVGVGGRVNKPTDCYDVWHVSENSGNYHAVLLVFAVAKNPIRAFELLFFAVFGQTSTDQLKIEEYKQRGNNNNQPMWTEVFFKFLFGCYMLVSVVVLINLLIAMMTDTYQRIQVNCLITTNTTHDHAIHPSMLCHRNYIYGHRQSI